MLRIILGLSLLLGLAVQGPAAPGCPANLLLVNGRIYTIDKGKPWAEAVAVCGESIGRVGTTAEVRAWAGPGARVVDLAGKLVVPGFNDAHVHLVDGAEEIVGIDLRPATSEGDFARRLGEHARRVPKGRWITGGNWDHEAWPTKALPTHASFDRVTADHPVFVQRLDGHMAVANALAMRLAGISRDTKAPDGGTIVRGPDGEPTGVFKDNAMALISRVIPPPTSEETLEKAKAGVRHAASLGVTTVQDMTNSPMELRAYETLDEAGDLPVRIYSIRNYPLERTSRAGSGPPELLAGPRGLQGASERPRVNVTTQAVKLFVDGSMGSGTAVFFEPYADDPTTSGLLIQPIAELERLIFEADAAGFQLVVHAIGDRANTIALDAFERLARERGARDRRPRIEHAQVVRDADKRRFTALGVIASIQPSHCIDDMRWAEARIGRARSAIAYDFKSFVDAGARIAFGTDWFVEPLDPMLGLYAAVTRQFPDGTPAGGWFPEERLTLAQAIEFYTLGSAFAEFAETEKGSIVEGKLADLVVLSKNLFEIAPREILTTKAVMTITGGRIVHETR
jgi:predicted amidohydrolase YtcJ